jgi:hypothetical protein
MKEKLSPSHSSEQQQKLQQQSEQTQGVREFGTPEEMLRFDAAQHPPPVALVERLRRSVAQEPTARLAWWKRWLSWLVGKSDDET